MAADHHTPSLSNIGVDDDAVQQTIPFLQPGTKKTPHNYLASAKFERFDSLLWVVA